MLSLCASAPSWAAESDNWSDEAVDHNWRPELLEATVEKAEFFQTQGNHFRIKAQYTVAMDRYESAKSFYQEVNKYGRFDRRIGVINVRLEDLKDRLAAEQDSRERVKRRVQKMCDKADMSQLNEHEQSMFKEACKSVFEARYLVGDSEKEISLLTTAYTLFLEASKCQADCLMPCESDSDNDSLLSWSGDESEDPRDKLLAIPGVRESYTVGKMLESMGVTDLPVPRNKFVEQCERWKLNLELKESNGSNA